MNHNILVIRSSIDNILSFQRINTQHVPWLNPIHRNTKYKIKRKGRMINEEESIISRLKEIFGEETITIEGRPCTIDQLAPLIQQNRDLVNHLELVLYRTPTKSTESTPREPEDMESFLKRIGLGEYLE